jgi:hypothetical protein
MSAITLKKATLQVITGGEKPQTVGDPIEVQFNPASLKLTLHSKVEGGETRGNQRRQWIGNASTELSFDLHFDTSEEGTTSDPVSVRGRTAAVEQFLLPIEQAGKKQSPPKVRFSWGGLVMDGIIEQLSIDFDHFAQDGTPLRAKMSVSIKEQDAKYQLAERGAGANAPASRIPGETSVGPGSAGSTTANRLGTALGGESAADFLARNGLDPNAWRSVVSAGMNPLSLEAGVDLQFDAGLSLGVGIGA